MITECPEEVLAEATLLTVDYSPLRSGFSKWRSFKYRTEQLPDSPVTLQEISDDRYFLLYSSKKALIQGVLFSGVEKRLSIKKSKLFFFSVKKLWDLLNPFHLPGISKKVYVHLLVFIYFHLLSLTNDIAVSEEHALEDCEVDFRGEQCLGFVGFYEGVFECVDYFTKSYLVTEYARLLALLIERLESSFWFNGLDLHNKLHVEGAQENSLPWMQAYLKPAVKRPRALLSSPGRVKVSQRLLQKKEFLIDKSENVILEKRINKLSRMQSVPIKYIVLNRNCASSERSRQSRPATRGKPTPKRMLKFRKNSHILEDVIENRKPQSLNMTQQILFPFF
jgi:hypothetical protein